MFIAILTLLSALSISGVAIFYSVIGLATIFPGAFWPVVIMGSVLEVGKLVTASWLYRHWRQTRFLLKSYLTIAVIVLSLITSMGIFGFLSKAHLEQNLAENTVNQRIEIINNKITSEETYIKRQTLIIERLENTLTKVNATNDDAISIEKQNLKDVQDKFKTLLSVETNNISNLSDRLTILDKDVSDVLTSDKAWFNEEKAAADLKASQKEERDLIETKINESQDRIGILKQDYANDTDIIQKRIEKLRSVDVDDKSDVYTQIDKAESNILQAQNNIDDLVVDREPLESKMIKLEAEVGPVKYIAALAVDWGVTDKVDTSEAVRWIILIIICVFDPLAVLLLVAANQSLLRRFPVQPLPPEEVLDLEKPDEEDITLKWNEAMSKKQSTKMDEATNQLKDWKEKLEVFNKKVPKPEDKDLEIIQKKTEQEEIGVDYKDPADVIKEIKKEQEEEAKQKQLEEFKKRQEAEFKALEEISRKAQEEEMLDGFDPAEVEGYDEFNKKYDMDPVINPGWEDTIPQKSQIKTPSEQLQEELEPLPDEPGIAEQIEEAMETERSRPDFTEVIEPEKAVQEMMQDPNKALKDDLRIEANKAKRGSLGQVVFKKDNKRVVKKIEPKVEKDDYVQNEEQSDKTLWNKIKSKLTTEEDYHSRIEKRIDDLMSKLDAGEISMEDLTPEDRKVIIEIRMQNESGDNI